MALAPTSRFNTIETLIPGLPDDISAVILCSLPIPLHPRAKLVSRSWLSFFSPPPSPSPDDVSPVFLLRRRLRRLSDLLCLFPSDPSLAPPLLLDPASLAWAPLPPLPPSAHLFDLSNFSPVFLFPHLYLLGGSHFDARSYPINHPLPSPSAHRLHLASPLPPSWSPLPPMPSPRGSFASSPHPPSSSILVAGGGSRHPVFPSVGSRIRNVDVLDARTGAWRPAEALDRCRAGCVGFVRRGEFWVMGGYGEYRALSGVVPRDVYCRDAVAMALGSGKWREVGDMGADGERGRLGKVAVVEGESDGEDVSVFMLDRNQIFRF